MVKVIETTGALHLHLIDLYSNITNNRFINFDEGWNAQKAVWLAEGTHRSLVISYRPSVIR